MDSPSIEIVIDGTVPAEFVTDDLLWSLRIAGTAIAANVSAGSAPVAETIGDPAERPPLGDLGFRNANSSECNIISARIFWYRRCRNMVKASSSVIRTQYAQIAAG